MNDRELKINLISQGEESLEEGLKWFDDATEKDRKEIMRSLDLCVHQSHPNKEDIEVGIENSGLKETYSPCVLIRSKPFNEVRQKILKMPLLDQRRAFIMLISIFSVADARRKSEQCANGCTHEWHNL